ncbi:glycosyltransferase family 61 protein [Wolbachia pipientis]|uniref:glycosyltransferase family 61 protein n=1 Tax=Wolbachia pipientis TaxID=955 RepID=UPI0021BE0CF8|nr:glycosyltransferase 61 family protein [Wolbachia pipientis]
MNNVRQFIDVKTLAAQVKIEKLLDNNQFILELPNGVVVNEGGVLTSNGYILQDTQNSLSPQHGLMKNNNTINQDTHLYFHGSLAIISSPGSENWYHWLLQILPRLIILKNSSFSYDRIYINNVKYKWQTQSLDIVLQYLNIPPEKLLIINGDCVIQATNLIVPSVPFIPIKGSPLPDWLKNDLKAIFLTKQDNTVVWDRIYISRANASMRRIINEKELITELEKIGFKVIHLELLSPYEQAQIFNHAQVIVGPHGSGFANLIFTNPGCKVVEIDYDKPRSFYRQMSKIMSCYYYPFYADKMKDEDMVVDIEKFIQFISKKF